jgi:hypothetical protein
MVLWKKSYRYPLKSWVSCRSLQWPPQKEKSVTVEMLIGRSPGWEREKSSVHFIMEDAKAIDVRLGYRPLGCWNILSASLQFLIVEPSKWVCDARRRLHGRRATKLQNHTIIPLVTRRLWLIDGAWMHSQIEIWSLDREKDSLRCVTTFGVRRQRSHF